MSNEDIIKEKEKATKLVRETARDVNSSLCHSRNVVENEDNEKAYNKGLDDAWGLVKKLCTMPPNEKTDIWGINYAPLTIVGNYTPQEVLAKIEAYEKENEIKVGDVVESIYSGRLGVITMQNKNAHYVLFMDGIAGQLAHDDIKKTGKHIDINSVLEELKG